MVPALRSHRNNPITHNPTKDDTDHLPSHRSSGHYGPALETIKVRRDFQAVRGGAKWSGPAFLMEARPPRQHAKGREQTGTRFGFTITKKMGGAVARNRIRRRLSHAIRAAICGFPTGTVSIKPYDYVVVARHAAMDRPFQDLVADATAALTHIARARIQEAKSKPQRDTTAP